MRLRVHLDSDKLDETQSFTDSLATYAGGFAF